jgi:RND family efflux transporter MFP subunit
MNKMSLDLPHLLDSAQRSAGKFKLSRQVAMVLLPVAALGAGVVGVAAMVATAPKPQKKEEAPPPLAVQVAQAQAQEVRLSVSTQGLVRAVTQATLSAQIAGKVVYVAPSFADGGAFTKGTLLARIDPADYELALVRAKAQVAQAEENLIREEAESAIALTDWQELGRQGAPSDLVLRKPQMAQTRAALAAAQAGVRAAELDLARTEIRAPFDGRIMEKRADLGDIVSPGAALATSFATDRVEVRIPLTDADLAILETPVGFIANGKNAPEVLLSSPAGALTRTWKGRLVRTAPMVTEQTRLITGYVEVESPFSARHAAPLAPGLFPTATLQAVKRQSLIAAPRGALKKGEQVFVVKADNSIEIRQVVPVQTTPQTVYFRAGLAPGERVVVSALPAARDGLKITPLSADGEVLTPTAPKK